MVGFQVYDTKSNHFPNCWNMAKFNTPGAQTEHTPDMSMLIWNIASFGTYDTKSDYVPN